jgi:hypothetical protein
MPPQSSPDQVGQRYPDGGSYAQDTAEGERLPYRQPATSYGRGDPLQRREEAGGGLLGRVKSLFGADSGGAQSQPTYSQPPTRLPPHLLGQPDLQAKYQYGQQHQSQQQAARYPQPGALEADSYLNSPPPQGNPEVGRAPLSPGTYPGMPQPQMQREGILPNMHEMGLEDRGGVYSGAVPPPSPQQQGAQPYGAYPNSQMQQPLPTLSAQEVSAGLVTPPGPQLAQVPPEPQVFVHGDNIVMILRPREFFRKKAAIAAAGPQSLQVFSDFERVMTRFRAGPGQRAMGTADLLESSGAVKAAAVQELNRLAEEFEGQMQALDQQDGEGAGQAAERFAMLEDFVARCQAAVAREAELHLASVAPVVRYVIEFTTVCPASDVLKRCVQEPARTVGAQRGLERGAAVPRGQRRADVPVLHGLRGRGHAGAAAGTVRGRRSNRVRDAIVHPPTVCLSDSVA